MLTLCGGGLWQPTDTRRITYGEMVRYESLPHTVCSPKSPPMQTKRVCQYANVLKAKGVGKGDNVVIYMVSCWKQ